MHAEEKLLRLVKVGITKEKVMETLKHPEKVLQGYLGRKIAQGNLTAALILRVVYEETEEGILIITAYPAERRRYK